MSEAGPTSTRAKTMLMASVGIFILGVAIVAVVRPFGQGTDKHAGSERGPSGADSAVEPPTARSPDRAAASSGAGAAPLEQHAEPSSHPSAAVGSASAGAITSGTPVDMTQLLLEAKMIESARSALAAGDPKRAIGELEFYDKIPNAQSLKQESVLLKIEAFSLVGRKAEARALAFSTRDDPSFNSYQDRINALLEDAGR